MKAIRAIVRGRVQGVSFRYATQRIARQLGVVGWVRNRPDGTVEAWAQGSDEAVQRFEEFLAVGPRAARVGSVDVREVKPEKMLTGFQIRF